MNEVLIDPQQVVVQCRVVSEKEWVELWGGVRVGLLGVVCASMNSSFLFLCYVKPLIMDTLKSGQPPYNGHTVHPLPPYITSEEGTTSYPLFGGICKNVEVRTLCERL